MMYMNITIQVLDISQFILKDIVLIVQLITKYFIGKTVSFYNVIDDNLLMAILFEMCIGIIISK